MKISFIIWECSLTTVIHSEYKLNGMKVCKDDSDYVEAQDMEDHSQAVNDCHKKVAKAKHEKELSKAKINKDELDVIFNQLNFEM
ncbi:hypothetical protein Bpfe_019123 [Biomphalaria pfeifferi]|uniref:Uncharacterized protein n=1 Tax=Biomphalaria pfeifferi TaxID=112525 RepID=A0AAD8F680_BIOPF|nr:hypothetical protein Bpfe_019123 [Biomphalaria pfeifferi]